MQKRFEEKVTALRESVLHGKGETAVSLRQAVYNRAAELCKDTDLKATPDPNIPTSLQTYIDKVILHAYKVTDKDVDRLLEAGHSEDDIFELTVCTAVGAGLTRLELGLAALKEYNNATEESGERTAIPS